MDELNLAKTEIEELIIRFLNRKASANDLVILRLWLVQSAENQKYFDELKDIWEASGINNLSMEFDQQQALEKFKTKISLLIKTTQQRKKIQNQIFTTWQKIAAILIISFMIGGIATYIFSSQKIESNKNTITEHVVPYGSKSIITLSDGTKVWLNSGSRLTYSQKFNISDREVKLEGEGYFDVVKNAKIPFYVKTSEMTLKVIGTAFNVKAYLDEKTIETTVERGIVQVFEYNKAKNTDKKILLHANQKSTLIKEGFVAKSIKSEVDTTTNNNKIACENSLVVDNIITTEVNTSWKDNKWIFEREKLKQLAIIIERRFNINIEFTNSKLENYVFSGTIQDESLVQVLEAIQLSAPIRFSINQNKVTLFEVKKEL